MGISYTGGNEMKIEEFNAILSGRVRKIVVTLGSKAEEYARGEDRLHNFRVAARMLGTTPEQALWGMAAKHLVSVQDMVDGHLDASPAMVDEKIGDLINYLILLEAVFNAETS